MAIPAGSKGGFFELLRDTGVGIRDFAADLPRHQRQHRLAEVRTLGLYVNTACNLACHHCYYQVQNGYRAAAGMPIDRLCLTLESALQTGVRLFAFVGKEVLLPGRAGAEKTLAALRFLAEAREHGRTLRLGLVTNGIFLGEHVGHLQEIGLDFLDVSFDGPDAASHDALRGKGSFERSARGLRLALEGSAAPKIFVASTLYRGNLDTLADILSFHERFGVRHFSIMPVVAVQEAGQAISLDELARFLVECLPARAAALRTTMPLEVVVDLDSYMVGRRLDAFEAILGGTTVHVDQLNNLIVRRSLGPLDLVARLSLPDPCNSYGCLTHDGLYFDKGGCLFMKRGYEERALGSVDLVPLDALIARHEARAAATAELGGLFGCTASEVTNALDATSFFMVPELV